jgi:two-component system, NtrC family, sensor kinase
MTGLKVGTKSVMIPLFWKFTIGMVVVVVLFGSINVALVHRIIFSSLEQELEHRGVFMSQIVSQQAINHILFDDIVALNVLIDQVKASDAAIEYILVCNPDCQVIAHTFNFGLPAELNEVHSRQQGSEILSAYVRFDGSDRIIRDISVPLLEGSIGFLRLGITEDNIEQTLERATATLMGMILILILISLVGTFIFSYLVTSPVKDISAIAQNLDMQTIRNKDVRFAKRYPDRAAQLMRILPGDEIDILVGKFNEMVSRLQQAYEDLEIAQQKLIQSEKLASIGTLAAGVAHEVNNPLAGIMNCIARMKRNPGNRQEADKYLELMEEATTKVEGVIRNLLDFARQPGTEKELINPQKMVDNALALASHRLDRNGIKYIMDNQAGNAMLWANQNRLEQVLLNLVINGIDAINEKLNAFPQFQGLITIRMALSKDSTKLIMDVCDNGSGIPEENMNKIFDPFFTTKEVGKGTGLGLSVSINIIKDHDGELLIKSKVEDGTKVSLILPAIIKDH